MSNLEIYDNVFMQTFMVDIDRLHNDFKMTDNELWDSVGHVSLIAGLEDAFHITIDIEDMAEIISYEDGKSVLKKYQIII